MHMEVLEQKFFPHPCMQSKLLLSACSCNIQASHISCIPVCIWLLNPQHSSLSGGMGLQVLKFLQLAITRTIKTGENKQLQAANRGRPLFKKACLKRQGYLKPVPWCYKAFSSKYNFLCIIPNILFSLSNENYFVSVPFLIK